MSHAIPRDEPGGMAPAVLSAFVHLLFFVFLYFGVRWQSRHADAVVVEIWNQLPVIEQPQPVPKVEPVPEPKPEPKVEPKPVPKPELKIEPRPEPKVEPKPQKPDIAVEREKKRPKKERPKKEEPPLKFDMVKRIKEQFAQEQQALDRQDALKAFSPPPASSAPPAVDAGYIEKIRSKIKLNIVLPLDIKDNPEAIFDVVQLPTGEVLSARLRKSSGHKAYDEAVERAILKSSPLPRPDRPEQFSRDLQLKFRPQE
ncbi:MAG: energy transducer TonB [Burkholderiales bacterium]